MASSTGSTVSRPNTRPAASPRMAVPLPSATSGAEGPEITVRAPTLIPLTP